MIRNDSAVASSFFLYKYKDNLKVIDGLLLKNNASAKLGANYMLRYYLQYAWKAKDYNKEEFYQDYKNVIINLRKFNISTGYISYRRFVYAFPSIHYKTAKYYKKFLRQRLRWTTYLQVIINIFYRY